jgi:dihydroxy-acid dehydratase
MRSPGHLRSARWFAPDDFRSFGHCSRVLQMGYSAADFVGKPVIAIVNTWSDANPCHSHFKQHVEDVPRPSVSRCPACPASPRPTPTTSA